MHTRHIPIIIPSRRGIYLLCTGCSCSGRRCFGCMSMVVIYRYIFQCKWIISSIIYRFIGCFYVLGLLPISIKFVMFVRDPLFSHNSCLHPRSILHFTIGRCTHNIYYVVHDVDPPRLSNNILPLPRLFWNPAPLALLSVTKHNMRSTARIASWWSPAKVWLATHQACDAVDLGPIRLYYYSWLWRSCGALHFSLFV